MVNKRFSPDWASAPGETIADILQERDLTPAELAHLLGYSQGEVEELIQGRSTISIALARQLGKFLGGSMEFWMSRDFQYRDDAARLDSIDRRWLSEIPLGDMIRFGWISPPPRPSEEMATCLRFFGVPTVDAWRDRYASLYKAVAFRTTASFDSRPAAVVAWLRRGEIEAKALECSAWNARGFHESLFAIRGLTRKKDPRRFVPELKRLCAKHGVAVTVVRAPFGCRASGATWFLSPNKAVLQLSFRYLTDDHLWFTFFHEAGHLLLHGPTRLFLEGVEAPVTREEEEANVFSEKVLIPPEFQSEMAEIPKTSRSVMRFARRIGVAPGIIVGQLQFKGMIGQDYLNGLKRRYTWNQG